MDETFPLSYFIIAGMEDTLFYTIKDERPPCSRIRNPPEGKSIFNDKIAKLKVLIKETERLENLLFFSEFSSKAPKSIVDKECDKLYGCLLALESWDRTEKVFLCE